ncbi:hypothetical protein A2276_00015 [candidate division WOR-1 bacterium RIFOXYA12_FULL_43_27]|uniref:bis(5'-nucleosyl)-tetraphosphatase (symmetrical) n=1 Tax=candidate division WOR-1 bacterium RIFOXYC2_FULL_46_14 TaxID=1802587 RepID=A0A1F4U489_UNCSA|nr:MAG: hypothetical protein A2276_00015 [candidate division WOR-1 bacterium RIFOXYA12_FULL_43_27]OGC20912.1 MAG: hypothetical protein A2292_07855 [candidate division WOR-1 bacterium RIFOXYB2_FULL_46_45]OGC31350.1 MAG: hypothetical protein A2232_03590 [candidate division WOR-1 bacterium RIFOXYA2_FULL_46_56]OGC39756.1 MAG: hypothetical protein A2438_04425 [candidate division WOR-1 bacterium RIFOXYC2_FULL_46_14]
MNHARETRYRHSLRVAKVARALAKHYRADAKKAEIAALLHDCSRFLTPDEMLKKAKELEWKIDKVQRKNPKLLHADLSAHFAKELFGITDPEILSAIRSHTVGSGRMSKLDKIVYLADHIEPKRDFRGVAKIRKLAFKNLDLAVIESLNSMIEFIRAEGLPIYRQTIKTRDSLLKQKNGRH